MNECKIQYRYTKEGDYRYMSISDFIEEVDNEVICDGEYSDKTLVDMVEALKYLKEERDMMKKELDRRNYLSNIKHIVNHLACDKELKAIKAYGGPVDSMIVWMEEVE